MKHEKHKFIVIALGGSIVFGKNIQVGYLSRLKKFLEKNISEGVKFIIVIGGGEVARNYQNAAAKLVEVSDEDRDWLGIHSTRLNAHLLRTIFSEWAYPVVLDSPDKPIEEKDIENYPLFIASGWRPGWSTDYIAFRLAHRFGVDRVLIATKVPYIYDKDNSIHKDAVPIEEISWKKYSKMMPDEWTPGMKVPVDPVAARFAKKKKIKCVLLRGTNITNLNNMLEGRSFKGSVIE